MVLVINFVVKIINMELNKKFLTDNYKLFLDSIEIPVLILNKYDFEQVIYYNKLLENTFSIDESQKNYKKLFQDVNLVNSITYYLKTFPLHKEIEIDENFFTLKSTEIYDYIFLFFNDITLIKRNDVIKRRYMDSISHELKTPLTNILLYTEKLQNCIGKNSEKNLKVIHSNASVLQKLIDDILALSKLDSTESMLVPVKIKLRSMIVNIMKELMPLADLNAIDIDILISSNIELYGDKKLLHRAFKNLIENGIRYNKKGGIVIIRAELKKNNIIISFEDDGVGIEKKNISSLFNRFFRADEGRTKGNSIKDGTGLGLSIVRNVIDQHKGIIEVKSELGKGSTFKIILPLAFT